MAGYLDHLRDHRRVGRLDLEILVHSAVGDGELLRAYYLYLHAVSG